MHMNPFGIGLGLSKISPKTFLGKCKIIAIHAVYVHAMAKVGGRQFGYHKATQWLRSLFI